ncbi:MAG: amidase family protein [Hyphomonadaceae bacterium JAD_PAG50586_4]|nr:MAG: amidase family protein [Hyphomonadaceae bacterium JAD_PAG50586_4]
MVDFNADPFVPGEHFLLKGAQTGPLAGLRFVVKDNLDVAGRCTCLGLPNYGVPAERHARIVAACLDAGADLLGKVVMDELAFSLLGLNAAYGPPLNPAAPGRVAGGSSCGSGSAVAQGLADFALGTDTAGSVRVPASFCGLWGLRPTHGAIANDGMAPLAHSFDTPGWICADAETMSRVSAALLPEGNGAPIETAVICDWLFDDALRAQDAIVWAEKRKLRVKRQRTPLSPLEEMLAAFRTVQACEAHGALNSFLSNPDVPADTLERIQAGARVAAGALVDAQRTCVEVQAMFDDISVGAVLLAPTAPSPPPLSALAEATARQDARSQILTHTILASLVGVPQISAPMWRDARGPVGLGVIAARGADRALIDLCTLHK